MSVYSNWKYFFDSFWKFVSRNSYPIVLVLFFIWICIGIFPLTCYESDSMHVIAGCNIMYSFYLERGLHSRQYILIYMKCNRW